jgi:hypothetical protein
LKQPALGIVAALIVMAISLGFISMFSFGAFTGWVAFFIQCMIPMQIVIGITWGGQYPAFAQRGQPVKGILLILLSVLVGAVFCAILFTTVGGSVSPPAPMPIMFTIVFVLTTFWLAIMWGNWPFSALFKNPIAAGLAMLVACFLIAYAIFHFGFDYGFMQGAPVYVPALDPHGIFNAWSITVWYVTAIAVMFFMLHFELWPLTLSPGVMKQPTLGIVWTLICAAVGTALYWLCITVIGMDVVAFLVAVPISFIFGTIVVLNMLQGSLFPSFKQPVKGLMSATMAVAVGIILDRVYVALSHWTTGAIHPGPPSYDLEIWTASALLGVTFPFLIFSAEFFKLWPFKRAE